MIYCFNQTHKFTSKHCTEDRTVFNLLKFCFNDKNIRSVIITKDNNDVDNVDQVYYLIRQNNRLFIDDRFVFMRSSDFVRLYRLKFQSYDEFITYIKQFHEYTWIKNNIYNVENGKYISDSQSNKKSINFYAITNTLGMPNRGPIIQTENKIYYFKRDIQKFNIGVQNKFSFSNWNHVLNPDCNRLSVPNVSVGPNIDLKNMGNHWWRDKFLVADSHWMKNYLINKFNILESLISVIPIYVTEEFYETEVESNKNVVGLVGYPRHDDIKNMNSLVIICKRFPNLNFEMLSSRDKSHFSHDIRSIPNLTFYNVPHSQTVDIMKKWGMYIGLSKRERGPAALQELKVLGIPTICPNHTGYSEFNPLISLDIKPFKNHSASDLDMISDAIKLVLNNHYLYLQKAQIERDVFWANEKSTKVVSKKWEDFFVKCIGV